ncbi:tetratricopeptide repeat protein [Halobacteriovorax sp.]|uniref:tetratricopeptide repeat protein n=1 Tax=Halobacteriovorax sp. TaxID=2020862 RepID=UPI0035620202
MKIIISSIFILIFSFQAMGKEKVSFEKQKRSTLVDMIRNEIKTIKKIRRRGPNLEYRLLELYSENLKIIKEVENNRFLKNRNPKLKRPYFFKQSIQLNKKVEKLGHYIVKKWPNYRSNGAIFYTLALNERDFNKSKKTEYYLLKSLRIAPHSSPIVHSIKTALAELYYNDKKYKKAIKFYKDVIKNEGDEWYAKHHYNIAWCLLKIKKLSQGLDHILKAYQISKSPRYVTVESQVLDAISIFFIQNDKIDEGVSFYIENVTKAAEYITKMATRAQTAKKFPTVNNIITRGLQVAKDRKQFDEQIMYYNYQLEFYRTFKRENLHLNTAKALSKIYELKHLQGEELEISVKRIKSYVGYLQVRLAKREQFTSEALNDSKLNNVLTYFNILIKMDTTNKNEYLFYQGETLFSVKLFQRAYKKYSVVLEIIKKEKKQKIWKEEFSKKVINSLLATLTKLEENGLSNYKYQTYVYSNHVNLWPKDKKSKLIYPKLFSIYHKNKKTDNSITVVKAYHTSFPQDIKAQKGMFAKVFDFYVKNKDIKQISYWIGQFNKGFLSYEKVYIKKSIVILAGLLFNEIDKKVDAKDYASANKSYTDILKNENYPLKIKIQTSFRLSLLALQTSNYNDSWKWLKYSLKIDNQGEIFKEVSTLEKIVTEYAQAQEFKKALSLSYKTITKYCTNEFKEKNKFYQKAISFSIIENNYKAVSILQNAQKKCNIDQSVVKKDIEQFARGFAIEGNMKKIKFYMKKFPKYIKPETLTTIAENKYWQSKAMGNNNVANEMLNILRNYQSPVVHKIMSYNAYILNFENTKYTFTKAEFNGDRFSLEIENNFSTIKNIVTQGLKIQNLKHPIITPKVSHFIANQYKDFLTEVTSFRPIGFNKVETNMFLQQMTPLYQKVEKEVITFKKQTTNTIQTNNILSYENYKLFDEQGFKSEILMRYPVSQLAISLDNQGVQ